MRTSAHLLTPVSSSCDACGAPMRDESDRDQILCARHRKPSPPRPAAVLAYLPPPNVVSGVVWPAGWHLSTGSLGCNGEGCRHGNGAPHSRRLPSVPHGMPVFLTGEPGEVFCLDHAPEPLPFVR